MTDYVEVGCYICAVLLTFTYSTYYVINAKNLTVWKSF